MKLFKKLILLISILSFALQCRIAVEKLFYHPTVTTSEIVKITDIDLPLITSCKDSQRLFDWANYSSFANFLKGRTKANETISWIKDESVTLEKLAEKWNSGNSLKPTMMQAGKQLDMKQVYIPNYGICYEVDAYDPLR